MIATFQLLQYVSTRAIMWLLVALVTILVTIPIYCEDMNYSDRKLKKDNGEDLQAYDLLQNQHPTFIRHNLEEHASKVLLIDSTMYIQMWSFSIFLTEPK